MPDSFAAKLVSWQKRHGRHDLPWQGTQDPYAIWVSEIMLQQTQVSTVVPFYLRFMSYFPTVASLAQGSEEAVLGVWSGLGYYARARHLHAAAQKIMDEHGGRFPHKFEHILALPGVGLSTAAAIAVFAFGQHRPILDGNVKRVLARRFGVEGWPGNRVVEGSLWKIADQVLPEKDIEPYTQGLMDLGATLCVKKSPGCVECPLSQDCIAFLEGRTSELPASRPRKQIPIRTTTMILLRDGNDVLLEKRPRTGVWGGLWSLPEVPSGEDVQKVVKIRYGMDTEFCPPLNPLEHVFTHFRLRIVPQPLLVRQGTGKKSQPGMLWLALDDAIGAALPSPVRRLLEQLEKQ